MINPYLNIEIVDIVAIVKHSVVVRIWQIIWRQLLQHLMVRMMMRVSGGDGGRLEHGLGQPPAGLGPVPEVEAGGGVGQDLLEGPRVFHGQYGVVEGGRGFTLVIKLQTIKIQWKYF